MFKKSYYSPSLLVLILSLLSLTTPLPAYAVSLLDTGEEPELIDRRSQQAAIPYEQVCRLEIDNASSRGSGALIGRKGREVYILTAAHNVWEPVSKAYRGSINIVFTLMNGHQIACPALQSYIPTFGPTSFFDSGNLNNDIAILKCLLPAETEFNITPLLFGDSEEGPINRYEGKFVGYGEHGINGLNSIALDTIRRLGETNLIEYREGLFWNIMYVLPVMDDKYGSFVVPYNMHGKLLTDKEFVTSLEMKNGKLDLDTNLNRYPFDIYDSATLIKQTIHPHQSRIMGGDSGGPLIVTQNGSEVILGVAVCQKKYGGLYFDNFTPISYYKKWIKDILDGIAAEKTYQYAITPNMHLGFFKGEVIEFKTKFGVRGILNFFIGLHLLAEKTSEQMIRFDKDQLLFQINDTSFNLKNYETLEQSCKALMDSGLFEEAKFHEKEFSAEVLAQPLFKELELFADRIDFYTPNLAKDAFERFRIRFRELKAKGLNDGKIPETLKELLIS